MLQFLEWQNLDDKELTVVDNDEFQFAKVTIDKDYNIQVKLTQTHQGLDQLTLVFSAEPRWTRDLVVFAVEEEYRGKRWRLGGIVLNNRLVTPRGQVEYSGSVRTLSWSTDDAEQMQAFKIYWFLGSSDEITYTQSFRVEEELNVKVSWGTTASATFQDIGGKRMGWSVLPLTYQGKSFLFGKVDKRHAESASYIRVQSENDFTFSELHEIILSLNFIVGFELIRVGHTIFNKESRPIARVFKSSSIVGIEQALNRVQLPQLAIRLSDGFNSEIDASATMSSFLELFARNNTTYRLSRVIWYVVYSRSQNPLVKIQPLASALDIICERYFSSHKNQTISRSVFRKIRDRFSDILDEEVSDEVARSEIKKRVANLNSESLNARNKTIFARLDLKLSELETEALRARELHVHGSVDDSDYLEVIRHTSAYSLVLTRLIFRLLGIETYIDYSDPEHPVQPVSEPQRGKYSLYKLRE